MRSVVKHLEIMRGGNRGDGAVIGEDEEIKRNDRTRLQARALCGHNGLLASWPGRD